MITVTVDAEAGHVLAARFRFIELVARLRTESTERKRESEVAGKGLNVSR